MPKLDLCSHLTSLVIGPDSDRLRTPGKPSLPSSLKHLQIHAFDKDWTEQFDWRCLEGCSHLESMVIPGQAYLSQQAGAVQLRAWLKSAKHLHVLAYAVPVNFAQEVQNQSQCAVW